MSWGSAFPSSRRRNGRSAGDTSTTGVSAGAISPADHPVFRAIDVELRRDYGRRGAGPYFLPWSASDSRFLRPLGIPCYGFAPFLLLTPETQRMGRNDEKISLPGLVQGSDLYRRVVERLATTAN